MNRKRPQSTKDFVSLSDEERSKAKAKLEAEARPALEDAMHGDCKRALDLVDTWHSNCEVFTGRADFPRGQMKELEEDGLDKPAKEKGFKSFQEAIAFFSLADYRPKAGHGLINLYRKQFADRLIEEKVTGKKPTRTTPPISAMIVSKGSLALVATLISCYACFGTGTLWLIPFVIIAVLLTIFLYGYEYGSLKEIYETKKRRSDLLAAYGITDPSVFEWYEEALKDSIYRPREGKEESQ